jgi:hypothetical protein
MPLLQKHIYLYNIHKEKAEALAKETGASRRRHAGRTGTPVPGPDHGRQAEHHGMALEVRPEIYPLAPADRS